MTTRKRTDDCLESNVVHPPAHRSSPLLPFSTWRVTRPPTFPSVPRSLVKCRDGLTVPSEPKAGAEARSRGRGRNPALAGRLWVRCPPSDRIQSPEDRWTSPKRQTDVGVAESDLGHRLGSDSFRPRKVRSLRGYSRSRVGVASNLMGPATADSNVNEQRR
jgi:hypothetical protein